MAESGTTSQPLLPGAASRAAQDAADLGTELAGAVRDSATALFEEQRDRAATEIAALGEVLRRSAKSVVENHEGAVARYADQAAARIGAFADGLRDRSWSEMIGEVEDLARRWPLAFVASAACAGWVVGRLLVVSDTTPPTPAASTLPAPSQLPPAPSPDTASRNFSPGGIGAETGVIGGGSSNFGIASSEDE
jgi:ElaB/YqjD/DUF883 family membrane-anchored ribosome-binding protein